MGRNLHPFPCWASTWQFLETDIRQSLDHSIKIIIYKKINGTKVVKTRGHLPDFLQD